MQPGRNASTSAPPPKSPCPSSRANQAPKRSAATQRRACVLATIPSNTTDSRQDELHKPRQYSKRRAIPPVSVQIRCALMVVPASRRIEAPNNRSEPRRCCRGRGSSSRCMPPEIAEMTWRLSAPERVRLGAQINSREPAASCVWVDSERHRYQINDNDPRI